MKRFSVTAYITWTLLILLSIYSPKILFLIGKSSFDAGSYSKGIRYFDIALKLRPDDSNTRYYYVKSLLNLPPNYYVQKEMFRFAKSKYSDSAKNLAESTIEEWKNNILENVGSNYIEQTPTGTKVLHWNKNSFPLKLYIDNSSLLSLPDYYKTCITRAINQWSKSVDFISFTSVNNPKDANITIKFEKLPQNVCSEKICKYVVGYTKTQKKGAQLDQQVIIIYDKNPVGKYFTDKDIYNTVLHELGHALGIMGHSYSSNDLMYQSSKDNQNLFAKYRSDFSYLSGTDVNTINLLYMLNPDITDIPYEDKSDLIYAPIILGSAQDIAQRKLEEALNYVKTSPKIASGYIDLAIAYAEFNDYKKALKALFSAEKLTKDNAEKAIIYNNIAIIFQRLNDHENAKKYYELFEKYN